MVDVKGLQRHIIGITISLSLYSEITVLAVLCHSVLLSTFLVLYTTVSHLGTFCTQMLVATVENIVSIVSHFTHDCFIPQYFLHLSGNDDCGLRSC